MSRDQHLGRYLVEVTGRDMILWPGACMVHEIFSLQDLTARQEESSGLAGDCGIRNARKIFWKPATLWVAPSRCGDLSHPEQSQQPFLVATEANMIHPLELAGPQHDFIPVPGIMMDTGETCACNRCPHMARNTLQKVRDCLKRGQPEITWQPFFDKAKDVLTRSLLQALGADSECKFRYKRACDWRRILEVRRLCHKSFLEIELRLNPSGHVRLG